MKCGRKACNNDAHPMLLNTETKLHYCPKCAKKINEYSRQSLGRDLIPWPQTHSNIVAHVKANS